jgi:hypothetical protein
MEIVLIYNNEREDYLNFTVFSDEKFLPFPQNLSFHWRLLFSMLLGTIFIEGTRLRLKILSYIRSPETKLNPVNILFCLDQTNGVFLALLIAARIGFCLLTVPTSEVLGPFACSCYEFAAGVYISGTFVWRFNIAVYRVLFIKAQHLLTGKIGMNNLLMIMILVGLVQIMSFSSFLVTSDNFSYSKKSCYRWSDDAQNIIGSYQVRI